MRVARLFSPFRYHHGFTLLEMSIVLVVVGLIVGAALVGKDMMESSQRMSVINGLQEYASAIKSFREKYEQYPGDMSEATDLWGSAGGTGSDSACYMAQTVSSIATCDGDGNGLILNGPTANAERFMLWKHLKNAEMAEGNFSGRTTGAAGTATFDRESNAPPAELGTVYDVAYNAYAAANHYAESRVNETWIDVQGIYAADMELIDQKIDDGNPVYGTVFTNKLTATVAPGCTSSDTAASAAYARIYTTTTCYLHYAFE